MTNKLQRHRAPRWAMLSRKFSRRQKIVAYVGSLAFLAACYGLGWASAWLVLGALVLETFVFLVRPSRDNPEALREAEALGLVDPAEDR